MEHLEVSCAVRHIYMLLVGYGLNRLAKLTATNVGAFLFQHSAIVRYALSTH
jgi:hypothetical protein